MKLILYSCLGRCLFILSFFVGYTIFGMNTEESSSATLYGARTKEVKSLNISEEEDDLVFSDSEEEIDSGENYNTLSEDGTLRLCEIIRNEGCQAALEFLKDKDGDQIDVTLKEVNGVTPLRETVTRYGKDSHAIQLWLELVNRGAKLDQKDEDFLLKNKIFTSIPDRAKLKRLIKGGNDGKKLLKYLILCPVAIGGIFLLYKILSSKKDPKVLQSDGPTG